MFTSRNFKQHKINKEFSVNPLNLNPLTHRQKQDFYLGASHSWTAPTKAVHNIDSGGWGRAAATVASLG